MEASTFRALLDAHLKNNNACTLLSARLSDGGSYGRVLREADGSFRAIVEAKDCTPEQAAITEVNTGAYVFRVRELLDSLDKLTTDNAQGELYLTDVPAFIKAAGGRVGLCDGCSETEMLGVNTVEQLSRSGADHPLPRLNRLQHRKDDSNESIFERRYGGHLRHRLLAGDGAHLSHGLHPRPEADDPRGGRRLPGRPLRRGGGGPGEGCPRLRPEHRPRRSAPGHQDAPRLVRRPAVYDERAGSGQVSTPCSSPATTPGRAAPAIPCPTP